MENQQTKESTENAIATTAANANSDSVDEPNDTQDPVLNIDIEVDGKFIHLSMIQRTYPVFLLRKLLLAHPSSCHITHYDLALVTGSSDDGDAETSSGYITPFSPNHVKILDDMEEVGVAIEANSEVTAATTSSNDAYKLKVLQKRYDLHSLKEHMEKTQKMLFNYAFFPMDSYVTLNQSLSNPQQSAGQKNSKTSLPKKDIETTLKGFFGPYGTFDLHALDPTSKQAENMVTDADCYLSSELLTGHVGKVKTGPNGENVERAVTRCLEEISFSSWNPPPIERRLVGDVLYIGVRYHDEGGSATIFLTATVNGFYVNQIHNNIFNPLPSSNAEYTTIVDALKHVCPGFNKKYERYLIQLSDNSQRQLQSCALTESDFMSAASLPHGSIENELLSRLGSQWCLMSSHKKNHFADQERATRSWSSIGLGMSQQTKTLQRIASENQVRDWNEELQSCYELPVGSFDERLHRIREIDRVYNEFIQAAMTAAIAAVQGEIEPINHLDPPASRAYVYNSLFLSFAKLESEVEANTSNQAVSAKVAADQLACFSNFNNDVRNIRAMNSAVEIVSIMDFQESKAKIEQEEKDAENANLSEEERLEKIEAKLLESLNRPMIHTVPTVLVDYLGKRVVVQAMIPGILRLDHSRTLKYGSVDNGETIKCEPEFHSLVQKVSQFFHLRQSEVVPSKTEENATPEIKICTPVEMKGISGGDGRYYVLDLARMCPLDLNYYSKKLGKKEVEEVETVDFQHLQGKYLALLRPELVRLYSSTLEAIFNEKKNLIVQNAQLKVLKTAYGLDKKEEASEEVSKEEPKKKTLTEEEKTKLEADMIAAVDAALKEELPPKPEPITIDPNSFTAYKFPSEKAESIKKSEKNIRDLSSFLINEQIPRLLNELLTLGTDIPVSGEDFTDLIHAHGINVRYLGKLATLCSEAEKTTHVQRQSDLQPKAEGEAPKEDPIVQIIPPLQPCALNLIEIEMVTRAIKRLVRKAMNPNDSSSKLNEIDISYCPGPFFLSVINSVLSAAFWPVASQSDDSNKSNGSSKNKNGASKSQKKAQQDGSDENQPIKSPVKGHWLFKDGIEGFWKIIKDEVANKFDGYQLQIWGKEGLLSPPQDPNTQFHLHQFSRRSHPYPMLRRLCIQLGVQIHSSALTEQPQKKLLNLRDLAGIQPRIKHTLSRGVPPEVSEMLSLSDRYIQNSDATVADPESKESDFAKEAVQLASDASQIVLHSMSTSGLFNIHASKCAVALASALANQGKQEEGVSLALNEFKRGLALAMLQGKLDSPELARLHMSLGLLLLATPSPTVSIFDEAIRHLRRSSMIVDFVAGEGHAHPAFLHVAIGDALVGQSTLLTGKDGENKIREALGNYEEAIRRYIISRNDLQAAWCLRKMAGIRLQEVQRRGGSKEDPNITLYLLQEARTYEERALRIYSIVLPSSCDEVRNSIKGIEEAMYLIISATQKAATEEKKNEEKQSQKVRNGSSANNHQNRNNKGKKYRR